MALKHDPMLHPFQPVMECPKCGAEHPDFDGMGFASCDFCDYCDHRTADKVGDQWICGGCGQPVEIDD